VDIHQQITDDIIRAIEEGTPPWRKGWVSGVPHFNASSGQSYHGINQIVLGMQPRTDPRWLTFKQAEAMDLSVRKGEKGVRLVKWVEVDRRQAESKAGADGEVLAVEGQKALVAKVFTVFNAAQIDGMAPLPERQTDIQPAEAVEAVIWGLQEESGGRLKLNFGGNQPAYYPRTDEIRIPPASDFLSVEDFHATLLHEAIHSTGHPKRLARLHLDGGMPGAERAREELVAELGAALTLASIGLPSSPTCMQSHAAYLSSWLELLKGDKREIFKAAALAQKACDYLTDRALAVAPKLSQSKAVRPEPEPETTVLPIYIVKVPKQ
jgi:putative DNA primase/helicase